MTMDPAYAIKQKATGKKVENDAVYSSSETLRDSGLLCRNYYDSASQLHHGILVIGLVRRIRRSASWRNS